MSQTREINLIPHDVIMREMTRRRARMWVIIVLMTIIFLFGGYTFEKRKIAAAEQEIADLSLKKNEIEEKIKQLNILQEKRDRLARKQRVINTLMHKRSLSLIFAELEKIMSNNVWLTTFNFKDDFASTKRSSKDKDSDEWVDTGYFVVKDRSGNKKDSQNEDPRVTTSLQGIAKSNIDLARFLELLSKSLIFSEVNLRYSREKMYESLNIVEFEIETHLKSDL